MSYKDEVAFICMTPVKNEAWILDRFLQCASTWADHIVIADQQSDDGSREIAERHEKVTLVDNPEGDEWDEPARRGLLIETARAIPVNGKRILLAIDADEALTANWSTSPEWQNVVQAEPGTVLGFKWVNVLPGLEHVWLSPADKWFGFVDDGSKYEPQLIHGPRIPEPEGAPRMMLEDVKVFHFQYIDWERMRSKQRWYQAWERLNFPEKRPVTIFRQYNHMYGIPEEEIQPIKEEWVAGYEEQGIEMQAIQKEEQYRWDETVLEMLDEHGAEHFRKIDIWDVDWQQKARELGRDERNGQYADPRSAMERRVHRWLRRTQPRARALKVRVVQKLLQAAGW